MSKTLAQIIYNTARTKLIFTVIYKFISNNLQPHLTHTFNLSHNEYNLYNIRSVCKSELCPCVCTAGSTVACLAFAVASHFNKQPLMNLQSHSYEHWNVTLANDFRW